MLTEKILHDLVGYKSISNNDNIPIINYIDSFLKSYNIRSQIIKGEKDRANIYAKIGPNSSDGLMLSGHTDVVPVEGQNWKTDPFKLTKYGNKYYGRGTSDMKGFISVVLKLIPYILNLNLKKPVHFMFSYDEEIGCVGIQKAAPFIKKLKVKPSSCIVGEPTEMKVINQHKGKKNFLVKFNGFESHSSLTNNGVNSIYYATEFINFLKKKQSQLKKIKNNSFSPPYSTINVGIIHGGIALNIVPKNCLIEFELRNLPNTSEGNFINEIKYFLFDKLEKKMKKKNSECFIEFETSNNFPPLSTNEKKRIVDLCLNASKTNNLGSVSFGTEAGVFDSLNIETIVCGPGSINQAHKPNEYIEKKQLEKCEIFLKTVLKSLC